MEKRQPRRQMLSGLVRLSGGWRWLGPVAGLNYPTGWMAEREGFEPPVRVNVQLISSQPHSTTLPPLRYASDGHRWRPEPRPARGAGREV
jgi:hypothetical protein